MKLVFLTDEPTAIKKAALLGFSCVELECSAPRDPRSGPFDQATLDRAAELQSDVRVLEDIYRAYAESKEQQLRGRGASE